MLREYLENATTIPDRDIRLYYLEAYLLMCTGPPELKPLVLVDDEWFTKPVRSIVRKTLIPTSLL
ncbi:hypothetical protein [Thermococcus piezophilus]|uniref:hypothetical protein n=1 Tax=Thermococcus piezophilus TaxID=1712654 RepID=UPI000A834077|nr:hypothetical protein [Thermococcus piezophilus]